MFHKSIPLTGESDPNIFQVQTVQAVQIIKRGEISALNSHELRKLPFTQYLLMPWVSDPLWRCKYLQEE